MTHAVVLRALMLAFDNVDLYCPDQLLPQKLLCGFRVLELETPIQPSPLGLADILIISMCAYTNLLLVISAAFSGVSQGCVAVRAASVAGGGFVGAWFKASAQAGAVVAAAAFAAVRVVMVAALRVLSAGLAFNFSGKTAAIQNSGQQKSQRVMAGCFDVSAKQFWLVVAGAGFEPTTFGL